MGGAGRHQTMGPQAPAWNKTEMMTTMRRNMS